MRYESAEFAKISINTCLSSSITTTNILAELCEKIGADWSEIIPALKMDKRIGQHAYIKPGLGISGGNLERDLNNVVDLAEKYKINNRSIKAMILNSQYSKNWAWRQLKELVLKNKMLAISEIIIASAIFLGIVYWEVKFLYTKTTVAK